MIDIARLRRRGWTSCDITFANEQDLECKTIAIAKELGTPVAARKRRLCEPLRPTEANVARPHTLSSRYATGSFPLHVDTAHWVTPCHYVILACANQGVGNRKTLLLDI